MPLPLYDAVRKSEACELSGALQTVTAELLRMCSVTAVGRHGWSAAAIDGGWWHCSLSSAGSYAHSAGGEVFACWACGCWFVGSQARRKEYGCEPSIMHWLIGSCTTRQ
jgi:hypothetical protein